MGESLRPRPVPGDDPLHARPLSGTGSLSFPEKAVERLNTLIPRPDSTESRLPQASFSPGGLKKGWRLLEFESVQALALGEGI